MREPFLNAAITIGNAICRDAIHHDGQCNWVGADNDIIGEQTKPYYAALKNTWYGGTSGIAWFLAQLGEVSGEKQHRRVALAAIEQAMQTADQIRHGPLGFHAGKTGLAFAAVEIGENLGRADLIERGLQLLQSLNNLPETAYTLDVIDGCAGAIPAVIRLQKKYHDPILEALLQKMGDYLLQQAQVEQAGISWPTMPQGASANLTGYAHGAAGIAGALLELYQHTRDQRFQKAALAGFAYEDACYDPQQENWPDFRQRPSATTDDTRPLTCGCAWCHGAPGIGLSRIRAYQLTGNENFKRDAQRAVNTTLRFFGREQLGNYSLCHGVFGNADLLLAAAEIDDTGAAAQKAEMVAAEAVEQYVLRKIPFPNGTQSDYNTPDMMLGQAGIGYGFLRLVDQERFGSVLVIH